MPSPPRRRRPALRDPRRGQRGVSIVLAMLVLMVLLVVVAEVTFDASIELNHAHSAADSARMRWVAEAAFLQARSALLMDIEAVSGEDAGGDTGGGLSGLGGGAAGASDAGTPPGDGGGGGGGGGGTGGTGDEAAGEEEQQADVSEVIARTDSLLDDWQDSVALSPPLGNDFTLYVEVEDEDSKINLLGLWTEDVEQRDVQREIVRNLLDKAFEGTSLDLSYTDATEFLDRLDDWVKGDRGSFDPVPTPRLKRSNAEDEASGDELDTGSLDTEERHLPLTLGELLLVEGLQPEHLAGFVEDRTFHPGLERYLTVWSHLELKPEPPQVDPFTGSPFTQGSLFDDDPAAGGGDAGGEGGEGDGAGEGGEDEEDPASVLPTNDGLVNVNTAPLPVLRALAPDEIPTSFLERLVEFRARIVELRESGRLYGSDSAFDQPAAAGEGSEGFAAEDDDDPVKFVFETTEDIVPKVEEEYGIELKVEPDVENDFIARLAVTSQVFTIRIMILDEKTERRSNWRSVVWRMQGAEEPSMLTLVPLEPYHDPRRMEDYPGNVDDLSEQRFERWTDEGYLDPWRRSDRP